MIRHIIYKSRALEKLIARPRQLLRLFRDYRRIAVSARGKTRFLRRVAFPPRARTNATCYFNFIHSLYRARITVIALINIGLLVRPRARASLYIIPYDRIRRERVHFRSPWAEGRPGVSWLLGFANIPWYFPPRLPTPTIARHCAAQWRGESRLTGHPFLGKAALLLLNPRTFLSKYSSLQPENRAFWIAREASRREAPQRRQVKSWKVCVRAHARVCMYVPQRFPLFSPQCTQTSYARLLSSLLRPSALPVYLFVTRKPLRRTSNY